jgi:hypothetical protein|eukprot:COSAG01_NODE_1090_length_11748_cov_58.142244_6_plen_190_part_00
MSLGGNPSFRDKRFAPTWLSCLSVQGGLARAQGPRGIHKRAYRLLTRGSGGWVARRRRRRPCVVCARAGVVCAAHCHSGCPAMRTVVAEAARYIAPTSYSFGVAKRELKVDAQTPNKVGPVRPPPAVPPCRAALCCARSCCPLAAPDLLPGCERWGPRSSGCPRYGHGGHCLLGRRHISHLETQASGYS